MINAEIKSGNGTYIARVRGHANYAPKGQDIVCAGVSALSSALLEALVVLLDSENTAYFDTATGDGLFEIRVLKPRDRETDSLIRNLFYMFMTGLAQIERQYPDYIKLTTFEIPPEGNDNDTSEQTMNTYREEDKG